MKLIKDGLKSVGSGVVVDTIKNGFNNKKVSSGDILTSTIKMANKTFMESFNVLFGGSELIKQGLGAQADYTNALIFDSTEEVVKRAEELQGLAMKNGSYNGDMIPYLIQATEEAKVKKEELKAKKEALEKQKEYWASVDKKIKDDGLSPKESGDGDQLEKEEKFYTKSLDMLKKFNKEKKKEKEEAKKMDETYNKFFSGMVKEMGDSEDKMLKAMASYCKKKLALKMAEYAADMQLVGVTEAVNGFQDTAAGNLAAAGKHFFTSAQAFATAAVLGRGAQALGSAGASGDDTQSSERDETVEDVEKVAEESEREKVVVHLDDEEMYKVISAGLGDYAKDKDVEIIFSTN